MSIIAKLSKSGFLEGAPCCVYEPELEVITGSIAYGVDSDSSDVDIYSICIPSVDEVFPHMSGRVPRFGPQKEPFKSFQKHHITINENRNEKIYDVISYNIVDFFTLAAECNPNIIDALFVPARCITHISDVGRVVRENRKLFLSKRSYIRFRGYAYSQIKKLEDRNPAGKRKELVKRYGYDVKYASHAIRLADECRQILIKSDLDIEENREELKAIRRGEWTLEYFKSEMERRIRLLDELYLRSTLREEPNYDELNRVLMICLEAKYGSLSKFVLAEEAMIKVQKYNQILKIING